MGAEVVRLPVGLTVEAISRVDSEAKRNNAMHLNQFENDANFKIHLKYTAREIDEQLKSVNLTPTCIIGGLGTSGHMSAIEGCIKIARREGLLIGLSSGAVVHAFEKIAEKKGVYVLAFPDTGYKYAEQFERYLRSE
ncbi:hypothetical protein DRO19_04165 [Candidatus Bathyarchaeota archaeon]|nr:MAG: hypothetical protein DRO19_04165 [Candidatus Bathyarchaeota archaeon]